MQINCKKILQSLLGLFSACEAPEDVGQEALEQIYRALEEFRACLLRFELADGESGHQGDQKRATQASFSSSYLRKIQLCATRLICQTAQDSLSLKEQT